MPTRIRLGRPSWNGGIPGCQAHTVRPASPLTTVGTSGTEVDRRLIESAGCAPEEIAYVGDRLDNDILPAAASGLTTVFIRRGPWGYFYATQPEVEQAHLRIESLRELPSRLSAFSGQ